MLLLEYVLVDDYVERRAPLRQEHLALAAAAVERGELVLGGALSEPADRALLVWDVPDRSVVEAFVQQDPYVSQGLVREWSIRPWTVVVGTALRG
ncbi:YciI-like protein [Motilibacter aurantiacus]|uniref:YciI-like protein n=1 Tax=Motilibacter aurantiacus TaxID=2714955 RepID=UPI00140A5D2D|nr:YciI-like protein [Motilibacter aurantiacus]NHC46109.1 hypothetical protein [Motilibacter aurantiacus]